MILVKVRTLNFSPRKHVHSLFISCTVTLQSHRSAWVKRSLFSQCWIQRGGVLVLNALIVFFLLLLSVLYFSLCYLFWSECFFKDNWNPILVKKPKKQIEVLLDLSDVKILCFGRWDLKVWKSDKFLQQNYSWLHNLHYNNQIWCLFHQNVTNKGRNEIEQQEMLETQV